MTKQKPKIRSKGFSSRMVGVRQLRKRFLIVCEGERSEPNYFRGFKPAGWIVEVRGIGQGTVALVREAVRLKQQDEYDQAWCVLDRNSFPAENFNSALDLASQNGIQVAYSNEAFELWYLLHFHFYQNAMPRRDCITKLTELMGHPYNKNSETIFDEILDRQATAIDNAKRLLATYSPRRPVNDNPSTTVHKLVEQLVRNTQP